MSILKVNTIQDKGGNTLLSSDGAGAISSGGAITNTPAFRARNSGNQSISASTWTKLSYDTENLDTDGCYDTSNYRFTPTTAGYYYIFVTTTLNGTTDFDDANLALYFNGSRDQVATFRQEFYESKFLSGIFNFNGSTDYIEAYIKVPQNFDTYNTNKPTFGGYRLIGA